MSLPVVPRDCPCGSGTSYAECCRVLHDGAEAATAEQLMRSRYAAFVVGHEAHLVRTWHPRTRPDDLALDASRHWLGLEVLDVELGGVADDEAVVEFRAVHEHGVQRERSRFVRRRGRWVYLDGEVARDAGPRV